MMNNVDAVIAALRIALQEAEKAGRTDWKAKASNRWINQLPGAWMGRWWHLKLRGDFEGDVDRNQFIGHVRATIAYLEANRDAIQSVHFWSWPFTGGGRQKTPELIDAEFDEITDASDKSPEGSSKPMRLTKR